MNGLDRVRHLRERYEGALDEAERLRAEYHREIVKLHRSGMSLREIADGLGMSHQRVHQIVGVSDRTARRGAAGLAAGALLVVALIVAGPTITNILGPVQPRPTESAHGSMIETPACTVIRPPGRMPFSQPLVAQAARACRAAIVALDPNTGQILGWRSAPNTLQR